MGRLICAIIISVFLLSTAVSNLVLAKDLNVSNSSMLRPPLLLGDSKEKEVADFLKSRSVCGLIGPQEGAEKFIEAIIVANNPHFGAEIAFRGDRNRVLELIRFAVAEAKKVNSKTIIAAGTVLNKKDALDAIEAGARLIVTPGLTLSKEDIDEIHKKGIQVVMGVGSRDEALEAAKCGADVIKAFPYDPKGNHLNALKGPMPANLHEYLNKVELVEKGTAELATFTNVQKFLQEKPTEKRQFRLPESTKRLVKVIRAAVPNKPILITGGVTTDLMVGGLRENLNVGAALSIASPANVDEVLWLLNASKKTKEQANKIKKMLNGPFDSKNLTALDRLVDTLAKKNPRVCEELLKKGAPKAVAAYIIERLALPKLAKQLSPFNRIQYIVIAKGNPDIKSKALGVEDMANKLVSASLTLFQLPEKLEILTECNDPDIIEGITNIRKKDETGNLSHIIFLPGEAWDDFVGSMQHDNKINNVTKPPRITILEQHPNANQYFYVEEGELIILATTSKDQPLRAYVVRKGEIVKVNKAVYHIAVNKTENVKFWVFNEDPFNPGEKVAKIETTITCIGGTFEAGRPIKNLGDLKRNKRNLSI